MEMLIYLNGYVSSCSVDKGKLWIIVEKADLWQISDAGSSAWSNKLHIYFFERKYSEVTYQVGSNPSEGIHRKI